ncbi:MupA/Atu3671 family FMN-dependent luciferase-like monooxygenase [Streptomyces sp. XH2]|uniref:MupA/Atu3671 family FMN-dependent luciferase-like monooxygenase n=1 Tax=Streptomyces sp. XH2 TaxID=3412483 RepID=UPI003C7A7AD8
MSGLDAASAALDQDLAAMAELSRRIAGQIGGGPEGSSPDGKSPGTEKPAVTGEPVQGEPAVPAEAAAAAPRSVHGPRVTVSRASGMVRGGAPRAQQEHLADLVRRYTAKTPTSKQLAQRYRRVLADSRAVVGFRSATKEMLYPIAGRRASGARLQDVDGNEYVDITMGFGVLLFGHEPAFVTEAVREHLSRGIRLGPRNAETGEAAELLAGLTGMERVAFANSGTEANSAAIRLARSATGRNKIVTFLGAYHGHADTVLGRSSGGPDARVTVPVSRGIPDSAVADLIVLEYGSDASLEAIAQQAGDIAAVIIEPVQSRHPELQPVEFVRRLRELTARHGIVLMFDEMLTGFRPALRGAQELYGVTPDLATYGKLLGGGFPIGAIAGRADIMDGVDGGHWSYGDDSYPPADTTFFGGTYIQHPVSMVAARAVLTHLKEHSPLLQERLNARTAELAGALNAFFEAEEFPLRMSHFGSQFRFDHRADMELLYHHLMLRGVHVWEWRNFFLSTAHSDGDLEFIADAVKGSLRELRGAGFFPGTRPLAPKAPASDDAAASVADFVTVAAKAPASAEDAPAEEQNKTVRVAAMAWNAAAAATPAAPQKSPRTPDFSVYFFGDYPEDGDQQGKYELLMETARFADRNGFHALWMPERHFHSFGGLFPNPAVLAAALSRETRRIRLNAGSVVLPLHDPIRVAEEWSMADNLSGGRVGVGIASGWHANDFVFFPDRFGRHKETMYEQLEQVRRFWRGEPLRRTTGDGEADVRLFPRPVQDAPPMYTAVVGNPASFALAARHDLGIVTNLMTQSVEQLAENIALYRRTREEHGLDPAAGRVAVLLHTYLAARHDTARAEAYAPLSRYMRASLSLFGGVTNSLGHNVDLSTLSEDDLDVVFRRAYDRYCDQRALIGTVETVSPVVDTVTAAGADELVSLVDFGVAPGELRASLTHIDALRRRYRETTAEAAPEPAAVLAPAPVEAPLSPGQQRIWFLERMLPGRTAYNETKAIRLDGPLDVSALRAALRGLVARHEGLRTVFRETRGEPRQVVRPPSEPDFAVVDGTGRGEEALRETLAAESARRFDLAEGPLFVTRLVKLADEAHVLVLSLHHIVVDAASGAVLTRDLSALYRSWRDGTDPGLPALTWSYAEHAREQAAALQGPEAAADLAYWRETLGGDLPVLNLPTDRPRPAVMTSSGRAVFRTLDPELSARLRELSRARRGTLFMTLLAGYAAMLQRVTGQDDIVIGTPISDRPERAADLLGFFVNTLALRFDLSGDPSFATLLDRVRGRALDAYDHAGVPFEAVVRELAPPRVTDRTPVFQVLAEYESSDPFRFELPDVTATPVEAGPDKALTDFTVYFTDQPQGIRCHLEYNTDLFDPETADRFFGTFRDVLTAAVAAPDTPLSRLAQPASGATARSVPGGPVRAAAGGPAPSAAADDLAPGATGEPGVPGVPGGPVPAEWEQGPQRLLEAVSVHEQVARRAAAAPGAAAVVDGDQVLTYGQLEEQAGRLAAVLRERGADGAPAALWLPRSAQLVVAMLAALKAGSPYVPLDPALGRARAEKVIAESGARVLVAPRDGAERLRLPDGVAVVRPGDTPAGTPAPAAPAAGGESLCYVIYTSGSTGTPKGVAVPHRAVTDLCAWHHRRFGFTSADRSALVCSQSFDASVLEVWPALTAGASLTVAGDAVRKDPLALARWYAAQGVTFSILPTALGETLLQLAPDAQPPLRHLLMGGDVLRTRPRPGTPYEVANVYGPTEVTVLCTVETVEPAGDCGGEPEEIAIGRPVDNVRVRVLDESGAPVPVGTVGELHVGGPGVARGYLHRPEADAGRFLPDPDGGPDARLYRTGDLVRWTADGKLQFRGRTDDQVKIRGFRVEPEEVSRALNSLEGVREAVVLARRNGRGEAYLAAFAVPADPVGEGEGDRQAFADLMADALAERLPEYLVPRAWTVLAALPVTAGGKLDRAGLPAPDLVTAAPAASPAPRAESPAPVPPGDVERRLRALWAAEFGTDGGSIAPDASFFDLGGHSITAIRLVNRAREEFGAEYPMVRFYERPTLRAMAAFFADGPSAGEGISGGEDASGGDAVEHRAPATDQQVHFARVQQGHALPQVFNVAMRLTLTGDLDVPALHTALTRLVARHEGLRTRIVPAGDDWQQEILRARPVALPVEDLTGLPAAEREAAVARISAEAAETPFDLATGAGPALRLLRSGERTWVLLFVLHHAVCDGWAVSLILQELAALYGAAAKGLPDGLATDPCQPGAYARWQREQTDPAAEERKLAFWKRELDGAPFGVAMPLDRPRPEELSGRGDVVMFTVPADVRADVDRLARRRGATPYAVTAAALGRLMARGSGQSDVVFNVSYANRWRRAFESLVTCATSGFALRVRDGEADSFTGLVDQVARTSVACIDAFMPPRDLAPLLRERYGMEMPDRLAVGFAYQNSLETDIDMPGVTVAIEDLAIAAARAEFTFGLVPAGDVLVGMAEYSSDLWDRATVEGWMRDYVDLLRDEVRAALAD